VPRSRSSTPELVVVPRRAVMHLGARLALIESRVAHAVRLLDQGNVEGALLRLDPSRAKRQPARLQRSSTHKETPDGDD